MAKKNEELDEKKLNEKDVNKTSEEPKEEEKNTEEETNSTPNEEVKLVANTTFCDKYNNTIYPEGTEFIISDVKETEKVNDKQYKISNTRAEELKASSYVD